MKNKFIKSTIILIIGGGITKLLGMVIKIIITRMIGTEGIGIYMMIMPTFSLLIAVAILGMPTAISKLVAEQNKSSKKLIFSNLPIMLIINGIILVVMFFASAFIANNLLHEPRAYYALIGTTFVLPFISISSILRGYFFGKQKMLPHVISNILEDIVRLIILVIGIPLFLMKGIEYAICFIVVSNIVSEIASIIILIFFLPKNFKLEKKDIIPNKKYIQDTLSISLPSTGSRLIGSIGYFLEPIILTTVLLKIGYSNHFVLTEYGIISGYIVPLITLPSFFSAAISQALLPVISKSYSQNNITYTKRKIKEAVLFSLLIGIPVTILLFIYPTFFLNFIYNTNEGVAYLKLLAPFCLILYIQSPLTTAMQALNLSKKALLDTTIGIIFRTFLIFICSLLKIGLWGMIIAMIFNMIYVTFAHIKHIKKKLSFN